MSKVKVGAMGFDGPVMTREQMIDQAVRRVLDGTHTIHGKCSRSIMSKIVMGELHRYGRSETVFECFKQVVRENDLRQFVESNLGSSGVNLIYV